MKFRRLARRTHMERGQIDSAPLVDVVFLLLLFFMLTSNFIVQPGIKVQLPKAVTSEIVHSENLVISITAQDLIYLDRKPIEIGELTGKLKEAAADGSSLMIKADVGASLGRIVEIWDLCRQLGIPQVHLATNQARAAR